MIEGPRMHVVWIVDTNVVSENSKRDNDKGYFTTQQWYLKSFFEEDKIQNIVCDLILGFLYTINDHSEEFKTHVKVWCEEIYRKTNIHFTTHDSRSFR